MLAAKFPKPVFAQTQSAPPHAVAYFADAFADYPLTIWLLQDEADKVRARFAMFEALLEAYEAQGATFVWVPSEGAVAIWLDFALSAPLPLRSRRDLRTCFLRRLAKQTVRRLVNLEVEAEKNCPLKEPHRSLLLVAVREQDRCKGIGGELVARLCKDATVPVLAETSDPKNFRFYMNLRFTAQNSYTIGNGSPQTWTFTRRSGRENSHGGCDAGAN